MPETFFFGPRAKTQEYLHQRSHPLWATHDNIISLVLPYRISHSYQENLKKYIFDSLLKLSGC